MGWIFSSFLAPAKNPRMEDWEGTLFNLMSNLRAREVRHGSGGIGYVAYLMVIVSDGHRYLKG